MSKPQLVALLPFKAHSERMPRKNFRRLGGKPLYAWMLDTLLDLAVVDRIVINTDAEAELVGDARLAHPKLLLRTRRASLCGDTVSMNLIIGDDIAAVPAAHYLMTHVTNPFLSAASVAAAWAAYGRGVADGSADSLFSVTRHQTRFYRGDGSAINHNPQKLLRTQDLEPWFEENSCMYLFSAASFQRTNARIGARPLLYSLPKREAVDIDDEDDWNIAALLAAGMQ